MTWNPCPDDKHAWKPILTWSGRYECAKCHAIGHKVAVTTPWKSRTHQIRPYLCSKCGNPRTSYKEKRCPACRG